MANVNTPCVCDCRSITWRDKLGVLRLAPVMIRCNAHRGEWRNVAVAEVSDAAQTRHEAK